MKNRALLNTAAGIVASVAITGLFLLILKAGSPVIGAVLFVPAVLINWFGILGQKRGEAAGMPVIRLIISLVIEIFLIYKLEPRFTELSAADTTSSLKLVFSIFACFILPLLLDIITVLVFAVYIRKTEGSK
ncbi:MAG TPA: hypothetical protein P5191_15015 [Ruminococcus sp.]|nr:hypothetical protein [Ruminococcus sp.]